MYVCMYVENRGRVFYFTLSYKLETSRLSFYQCMLGPVFLFLLSLGKARTLAPMFPLVQDTCLPWLSMVCAFTHVSLLHPEFVLYESFARNQWIRSTKPHLIENATQSPEVDFVQRGVARIQVKKKICGFNNIRINVDEAFSLTWTAATYIYWNKKQVGVVRNTNKRWCDVT